MREQLATTCVAKIPLLAGMAERFGGVAVEAACMAVHQFPAALVGTVAEATAILRYLEALEAKG